MLVLGTSHFFEKATACSQFHEQLILLQFTLAKKIQTQTVSAEKQSVTLLYKNVVCKMLLKLRPAIKNDAQHKSN